MNIAGSININLQLKGIPLIQNMKVLNSKTFRNVILGRDFLSHFRTVEFDFANKSIKLNNIWCSCVDIKRMEPVSLHTKTSIPSRSETIVQVKCKKSFALITADLDPTAVPSKPGIYPTYCRVIPNIEGVFYISLLNVRAFYLIESAPIKDNIPTARLSVEKLMTYDRATMVHKILKEMCPEILKGKFIRRTHISKYETRRINDLQIPKLQLKLSKKSFSYVGAKVWNDIPNDIRNVESSHHFKQKMKSYLLGQ